LKLFNDHRRQVPVAVNVPAKKYIFDSNSTEHTFLSWGCLIVIRRSVFQKNSNVPWPRVAIESKKSKPKVDLQSEKSKSKIKCEFTK